MPKVYPFPELLGDGPWEIQGINANDGPATSVRDRIMRVPLGVDPKDWALRLHEMAHAAISPAESPDDVDKSILWAVEDYRIGSFLAKHFSPEEIKGCLTDEEAATHIPRVMARVRGGWIRMVDLLGQLICEWNGPYREPFESGFREHAEGVFGDDAEDIVETLTWICDRVTERMGDDPTFEDTVETSRWVHKLIMQEEPDSENAQPSPFQSHDGPKMATGGGMAGSPAHQQSESAQKSGSQEGAGDESSEGEPDGEGDDEKGSGGPKPSAKSRPRQETPEERQKRAEAARARFGVSAGKIAEKLHASRAEGQRRAERGEAQNDAEDGVLAHYVDLARSEMQGDVGRVRYNETTGEYEDVATPEEIEETAKALERLLGAFSDVEQAEQGEQAVEKHTPEWAAARDKAKEAWEELLEAMEKAPKNEMNNGEWAPLEVTRPDRNITYPMHKIARKLKPRTTGDVFMYPSRDDLDGKVFASMKRSKGGAVLIDHSGSMSLSEEEVRSVIQAAPRAIVAAYSGNGETAELRILAQNGKASDAVSRPTGQLNSSDGLALRWLAKQRRPRIWISDGYVNGKGGRWGPAIYADAKRICRKAHIRRVRTVAEALELLKKGGLQ